MESRSSVGSAARAAQRQLVIAAVNDIGKYPLSIPDDEVVERLLDEHGEEHRQRLTRVEAELAPALQILRRNRGRDVPSVAVEGITARIQTALNLLKGE